MKAVLIIFIYTVLISSSYTQEHNIEWARSVGQESNWDIGRSIVEDDFNNVYVTGYFQNTTDFDPDEEATFNLESNGSSDIFILKLDSAGKFLWAKSFGGSGSDMGSSITTDFEGNVYVTGDYRETVDFDPGVLEFNLTSSGEADIFVLKLTEDGDFVWCNSFGASESDYGASITISKSNYLYLTGYYLETIDADPGPDVLNFTSNGIQDVLIQKFDLDGSLIWAESIGSEYSDVGLSIVTDSVDNVILSGNYFDTVDFDTSEEEYLLSSNGLRDIFILKLDSGGNFIWANSMGGSGNDTGNSVTIDSFGNSYLTGNFRNISDFDPTEEVFNLTSSGYEDIFIQKFNPDGDYVWVKAVGSSGFDSGRSISSDQIGNTVTTGSFMGTVDFDPGPSTFTGTSEGFEDIYVLKLDSSGIFDFVYTIGGTNDDKGRSVCVGDSGEVFLTGHYHETVDFNPKEGVYDMSSTGSADIFIEKFSFCLPNIDSVYIEACESYTWINEVTYEVSNYSDSVVLINSSGCDSIIFLNLTIHDSSTTTDFQVACSSFVWIDGVEYFEDTDTNTYLLTSVNGCDSLVTLNLLINHVNTEVTVDETTITAIETEATYQWLDCSDYFSAFADETDQTYISVVNGIYAVEITKDDCVDTSECITISSIGLIENQRSPVVSIYPNPVEDYLIVQLHSLDKAIVIIYNSVGEIVYDKVGISLGYNQFEFDTSPGVYFIEILTDSSQEYHKVIKK